MLLVQTSFGSYRKLLPSVVYERNSASVNPDSLRIGKDLFGGFFNGYVAEQSNSRDSPV